MWHKCLISVAEVGDLGVAAVDGVSVAYVFDERVAAVDGLNVAALNSVSVA